MEYDFRNIEERWRVKWKQSKIYKVSNDSLKPKCYVLDMFPYPSGAGLHVGHPLGYIASDIYSRYKRLKGFNVLHPMGFDSFGLPAEQYAIETGQHPAETTKTNIATFKAQLDKIGFCYDWDREVQTSDPHYYKWTQWIFLQLFNSYFCSTQKKARPISELVQKYETMGTIHFTPEQWKAFTQKEQESILMKRRLAFSAYGEVNWCEALGTVLANDEVVNGVSERGGHIVIKKKMRQWYLRITAYADRLLEGLEQVDFSDSMKEMQRNWIGKSEGAEMKFQVQDSKLEVNVYTTRPDTIFGVDFLVIAPEHELVSKITSAGQRESVDAYLTYVKSRSDRERMAEVKQVTGCFTGAYTIHPFDRRLIPVWIAEYVLAGYGTGAIMAVPCGDQRDFLFAMHFSIPVTNIIGDHFNGQEANPTKEAVLQNSGFLNGLVMRDAIPVALNKIEDEGIGKRKVNYRMRDAGFSRQRYWGEPFPIVWVDEMAVPLDESELPLELPYAEKYGPGPEGEGPLANLEEWASGLNIEATRINMMHGSSGLNANPVDLTPKSSGLNANPLDLTPKSSGLIANPLDLTPNPSPKERGMKGSSGETYGYITSTPTEWKHTIEFAKQNRREPTEEENIMWETLRNRNLNNYKFRRQHPIAGYIPDFVCLEKKLIIEIDGAYHHVGDQQIFDAARRQWLNEYGYTMLRFSNTEVTNNIEDIIQKIIQELETAEDSRMEAGTNSISLWSGVRGEVKRETSTMPGYAGSSWYFLRYMDPNNKQTFCDRKASDYWNQVDVYIGGTEHAVGHLLYSRMWTKFLYDRGLIGFDEPFKKLVNQGMIQGVSAFAHVVGFNFGTNLIGDLNNAQKQQIKELKEKYRNLENLKFCVSADLMKYIRVSYPDPETDEQRTHTEYQNRLYNYILKPVVDDINKLDLANILKIAPWNNYYQIHIPIEYVNQDDELDYERLKNENVKFSELEFVVMDKKFLCSREVEKMSKSKYNVVNPDNVINKYGADTFRMYEMFLGPVEASKPWDTKGIEGVHRFLKKLWRLFFDEVKGKVWNTDKPTDAELKVLHRAIKKIEEDTERFSFNTAVSGFMICVNDLSELKCHKKDILENVLILLTPYAPHISEELWQALGNQGSILDAPFPAFDANHLVEATKDYPVSINGKLRTTLTVSLDATQEDAEKLVLGNDVVQKWLEGKPPKKVIYVKNKMINVVV